MMTEENGHKYVCPLKFIFLYLPIIILTQILFIISLDVLSLKNMKKNFQPQNGMVFSREHPWGLRAPYMIRDSSTSHHRG